MDSSVKTRVPPSVASRVWRSTALAPEEMPVQVSSFSGSTTAKVDLMVEGPLFQVKVASGATVESRRTVLTPGIQAGQLGASARICQTRATGAWIKDFGAGLDGSGSIDAALFGVGMEGLKRRGQCRGGI